MEVLNSLKLVFFSSAVIINILLALLVYRNNPKSATNIIYGLLGLTISIWIVVNYLSMLPGFLNMSLFLIRVSIALATLLTFLFFLLTNTMPYEKVQLSRSGFLWCLFITISVMIISVSPYSYTKIEIKNNSPYPTPGIGLIPFNILTIFFSITAVYNLIKKMKNTSGILRQQLKFVMFGILFMVGLLVFTVVLPVIMFGINTFVSFISLYTLIFLAMTAYAIVKHHLFNIKVVATEGLTVILWIVLFSKIFVSQSISSRIIDTLIFTATFIFGVLLIKSVLREVEQREKLEVLTKDLQTANEKLRQLDKLKSEFLSFASHQVKSPMSVVKGYASLIFDGTYGVVSDKVKEIAQKIKESADKMIALVNNLLDLRKIEEGKMEYKFEQADITDVIKTVVDGLMPLAQAKNLSLTFESKTQGAKASLDVQKFTQVIQNLVDNAIKYTEQGWIKVVMNYDNEKKNILITVSDSGRGMSKELLPRLFEQFTRDSGVRKLIQGTGLGLYIAKQIILAHNGDITAYSEGEGKGSVFTIRVPVG